MRDFAEGVGLLTGWPQPAVVEDQPVAAVEEVKIEVADAKSKQQLKDRAAKIYKQHVEIVKLRHELTAAAEEKKQLEEEIKTRSEEVY